MSKDLIRIGKPQAYWNVARTRIMRYTVEMYHEGLNEHKLISAPEMDMAEMDMAGTDMGRRGRQGVGRVVRLMLRAF